MKVSRSDRSERRKSRTVVAALLLATLVAAVGLRVITGCLLNTERLRSELAARLQERVGVPVQIGRVAATLFPSPGVALHDVRIGDDDVYLRMDVCQIPIDMRSLARRELRVTAAHVKTVEIRLPGQPQHAAEHLAAWMARLRDRPQGPTTTAWRGISMDVQTFDVRQLRLLLDDGLTATGTARIKNVTGPQIEIAVIASLAAKDAQLSGTLHLERRAGHPLALTGQALLEAHDTIDIPHTDTPLRLAADAHIAFSGSSLDDIAFEMAGNAAIEYLDTKTTGTIAAKAWWQQAAFIINDLNWQSPGLSIMADATLPIHEQEPALRVYHAVLEPPLAQLALDWFSPRGMRIATTPDAAITVDNLLTGITLEGLPRLASGAVTASGLTLLNGAGETLLDGLRIAAEIMEGRMFVQEAAASGWTASGWIMPDVAARTLRFDAQAVGHVDTQRLELFFPRLSQQMETISGTVELTSITGVYNLDKRAFVAPYCEGTLSNAHISWYNADAVAPVVVSGLDIAFRYENAVAHIDEARFGDSLLAGMITLDAGRPPQLDVTGVLSVADIPQAVLPQGMPIYHLSGRLMDAAITMPLGGNILRQLTLAGTLRDVGARIQSQSWPDALSGVTGTLSMENAVAQFALTGNSERLGGLRCEGVYSLAAGHASGELMMDMGTVAGMLLPAAAWRVPATGVAGSLYGQSGFAFAIQLPGATNGMGSVELRRHGAPLLHFSGVLGRGDAGDVYLQERSLQAEAPLSLVVKHVALHIASAGMTAPPIETEGMLQLQYQQGYAQAPFRVALDAASCAVRLHPWIEKKPGVPLRLVIQGDRQPGQTIELLLDEQSIAIHDDGTGNYQCRDAHVALETLQRVVSADLRLGGAVNLSFNTAPLHIQAELLDARVTLPESGGFGPVNGLVVHNPDRTQFRDVFVRGDGFDCRVDATYANGAWQAALTGERIDINRMAAFNEALARLRGRESPREQGMVMPDITGTLDLRVSDVIYRRGAMRQVSTLVQFTPESIALEDISFRLGRGRATGRARLQPEHTGTRRPVAWYINLDLDAVETAYAERLLFDHPRDLAGIASGTVEAQWPTGKEGYRRMDGKFMLRLRDGSLGRLGFATRLTTLLRNREVVYLRAPSLRDEGLTYDTATVAITMRDGRAQLGDCTAVSRSYSINASGLVDFARMHTDAQVAFNVFEGVADLVERVPVIGPTATSVVRDATTIRLRATGSPFDIRWQPDVLP